MSRNLRRTLITPIEQNQSNSHQIHQLVANTNEKNMLFYEFEIVDKDKEAKWARKQARQHGILLLSRWLFMLVGNAILSAILCAICGILIYVNSPLGITVKPLTYGQVCSYGAAICDPVRYLTCSNNECICSSNRYWNSTDCTCTINQYWDGLSCVTKPGYQQPCSTNIPCYSTFVCDPLTNTCLCNSSSSIYYTKYYTGDVNDLYTGSCIDKKSFGGGCVTYGVNECQEYKYLTCSLGNGVIYTCNCYEGFYWRSDYQYCVSKGVKPGDSCVGGSASSYGCDLNKGLECSSTTYTCGCPINYYWNNDTNTCIIKGGYQYNCYDNTWCNTTIGLQCYFSSMTRCDCPTLSTNAKCDCPSNKYWDGQRCSYRVAIGSPCRGTYACATATCIFGYCLT